MTKKGSQHRAAALAREINSALGTRILLGSDEAFEIVRIPTGSLVLDRITGGGFALGRHVELYGDESSCKSFVAYRTMALSQQRGRLCALVDAENTFDREWYERLGGNPGELLTFHPTNADEAIAVMMTLAKYAEDRAIEVVTIDSVSSMTPREDMERDPRDEDRIGSQARMMSRALRKITTLNQQTLFIWINQLRANIGIRFGNPTTTSGGKALRFYATTRIEMRRAGKVTAKRRSVRAGKLENRESTVGRWIQVRCEKDKSTRPYREGSFIFDIEKGEISLESEIVELGLLDGLMERHGNTYTYTDLDDQEWKGNYKQFCKHLQQNEDLKQEMVVAIQDTSAQGGD